MAYLLKLFIFASLLALSFPPMAESRPNPRTSLAARLKLEGETSDCWGSLFELQACTNEVMIYFFNHEVELGLECCRAIRVIQQECWPTLLGSLGYTVEESDILEAYRDTTDAGVLPTLPPPPPAEQPKNPVP